MNRLLDAHCEQILQEYRDHLPEFQEQTQAIQKTLRDTLDKAGIVVTSIEARVKAEARARRASSPAAWP